MNFPFIPGPVGSTVFPPTTERRRPRDRVLTKHGTKMKRFPLFWLKIICMKRNTEPHRAEQQQQQQQQPPPRSLHIFPPVPFTNKTFCRIWRREKCLLPERRRRWRELCCTRPSTPPAPLLLHLFLLLFLLPLRPLSQPPRSLPSRFPRVFVCAAAKWLKV